MSHEEGKPSSEESELKLRAGDGCGEKSGDKDGCAICFNDIIYATSGEPFTNLPCGHEYHTGCIMTWLRLNTSCPKCQYVFNPTGYFAEYYK